MSNRLAGIRKGWWRESVRRHFRMINRFLCFAFLVLTAVPGRAQSQDLSLGLRLQNVSAYVSYYSSSTLAGVQPGLLGSDLTAGGSVTLGWTEVRSRSTFLLNYTAAYSPDITYSQFDALNHNATLSFSRTLSSSWTLTASSATQVMNTSQFVFQPGTASQVGQLAATPDELAAAAFSNATYNNPRLASILTAAPLLDAPTRQVFFGDRLLNTSFLIGAAYKKQRLTVGVSAAGTHTQSLSTSSTTTSLVPSANSGLVGLNLAYSLSPRTEVGASVSTLRTVSGLNDTYTSTVAATLAHRMSQRWFVQSHAGTGFQNATRSVYPVSSGLQYIIGGGLGFKTYSHAFLANADRNISDAYGYGAGTNLSATGSWIWARPGRSWSIQASGGAQRLHTAGLSPFTGLLISVGFTEHLSGNTVASVSYAYLQNQTGVLGLSNQPIHSIRVAFGWAPSRIGL